MCAANRAPARAARAVALCQALLGVAGPCAVTALLPSPRVQMAALNSPQPDAVAGGLALLLATGVTWLLMVWGLLVLVVAVAHRLPGAIGRAAGRLLAAITPALVRRVVLTAAGVSMAAGLAACGVQEPGMAPASLPTASAVVSTSPGTAVPAMASAATSTPSGPIDRDPLADFAIDLDWPMSPATDRVPAGIRPTATLAPTPAAAHADTASIAPASAAAAEEATPAGAAAADAFVTTASAASESAVHRATSPRAGRGTGAEVVVLRGDTLWSIAARRLPAGSSAAVIDGAWRAWYSANADTIGTDPNLIKPGQILRDPATAGVPAATTAPVADAATPALDPKEVR